MLFVIREISVLRILKKRLDTGKDINYKFRYISNLIEISYPTFALVLLGLHFKSIEILFTPIVYFYFLILVLSTLSLEFKISLFVGIIAASEYLILFFIYRNKQWV